MPLLHCRECHHEWESVDFLSDCNWCGNKNYILKDKTSLEEMIEEIYNSRLIPSVGDKLHES